MVHHSFEWILNSDSRGENGYPAHFDVALAPIRNCPRIPLPNESLPVAARNHSRSAKRIHAALPQGHAVFDVPGHRPSSLISAR